METFVMATEAEPAAEDSLQTGAEDDLLLLLDCLSFQKNSPSAQKQILTTIATMCSNSNSTRNLFHSTGGLLYVLELLFEPQSATEAQQAALYTLGCAADRNHVNQHKLCTERLFSFLTDLLVVPPNSAHTMPVAVAYLSSCLMSHNVDAQRLAKNSGLLSKLISLFKCTLPSTGNCEAEIVNSPQSASNQELWSSMSSALCTATNNPQNEMNQYECIKLFPAALSVLSANPLNETAVRLSVSLIASCTANNKVAQDRLRLVGGLKALVATLSAVLHTMSSNEQSSELPLHIIKTLSAATLDHRINCEALIGLECIELLLRLLQVPNLSVPMQLNAVVCLGMLAEESEVGQSKVAKSEGMCLLIDVLAHSQDDELNKATTFLLQCCVDRGKPSSPPQSVLAETAARVDQLLTREVNESIESANNVKYVLERLSKNKLPSKDLVKTWLNNYISIADSTSQPEDVDKPLGQTKVHSTVATDSEQSHTLQLLKKDKERLETLLKVERKEREKLEQELLSQKQSAKSQAKESQTSSQQTHKATENMKDKERLETLLKVERKEREKLEQELLSQKQSAKSQAKQTKTLSQQICKATDSTVLEAPARRNVRYSSNATRTDLTSKRATQAKLISKISQLQLSHKISKEIPRVYRHKQLVSRTEGECSHQCIGCKPRLKCPLVNSRNIIKLLRIDHYTCPYHRRIAFKLRKDPKKAPSLCTSPFHPYAEAYSLHPHVPHTPHATRSRPHTPHTPHASSHPYTPPRPHTPHASPSCPHTPRTSSRPHTPPRLHTPHASPVSPVDSNSTASIGQETPFDCQTLSDTRDIDSDYIPSPSSHDTASTHGHPRPPHSTAQIQQGFNPGTYRLLPRTCGPSQQHHLKKLRQRPQPLGDITNKTGKKSHSNALSVFDYNSPTARQASTAHNIVVVPKKVVQSRAKAVPWSGLEESFLREGVQLIGTGKWRHILAAYPFHSCRDPSSLRVKYRNMMAKKQHTL